MYFIFDSQTESCLNMSWFKRRSDSKASQRSSDTGSISSDGIVQEARPRRDTDPATCLEVFRNHWDQAYVVISRDANNASTSTVDEIEAVRQNFEQMVTLLAEEEGEEGQGMPGPILHFLLEHEILEKFCGWCHRNNNETSKLTKEQLRMFEHLISQSRQLLLIHKPVIRPLLNLLAYCSDDVSNGEIEISLVLVLHQICISISNEKVILESFFNMNADHGVTKFLIFSLLIPFLHREGVIGQQARDALLLIMALSSKHPYIGEYIAENSDFCPVLATGLSGLYSDLPRKIVVPSEDWYQITDDDVANMREMSMFLNSLEFCNAVAQIAHPLVRDQLIKFIYNGFLVPVLGPALHQKVSRTSQVMDEHLTKHKKVSKSPITLEDPSLKDVSGLPTPLLDSPMFSNSREEVITATAYLDLFLRKITEPALIKAFLKFIFTEKNDEIVILDSLITRITSSSKLSLVSLSLFYTLVDLNCEDVMFDLVFKHLIPCTHVMVSQRRSVRDQDIYGKSVEKFMSLRPTCCLPEIDSPKHNLGDLPGLPIISETNISNSRSLAKKLFRRDKQRNRKPDVISEQKEDEIKTAFPAGSFGSKLEHFETSFLDYLHDAHITLHKCAHACHVWLYPYDGDKPSTNIVDNFSVISNDNAENTREDVTNTSSMLELASINRLTEASCDNSVNVDNKIKGSAIDSDDIVNTPTQMASVPIKCMNESEFLSLLDDSESPVDKSFNIEDSMKSLESILSTLSLKSISKTSTPRKDMSSDDMRDMSEDFLENGELSTVYYDCETTRDFCDSDFKSANETSFDVINTMPEKSKTTNGTEFEIVDSQTSVKDDKPVPGMDSVSFVNISAVSDSQAGGENINNNKESSIESEIVENHFPAADGDSVRKSSLKSDNDKKGDKSVRFAGATSITISGDSSTLSVGFTAIKPSTNSPSVGPFLTAVLLKLESMMQNSLMVNLVLTGLISRLAAYPQPLLRSYLLNQTLVFQPTIKSLVQVLTLVRQKVDHYSYTVQNFEALLLRARRTLAQREGLIPQRGHSLTPSPEPVHSRLRSATTADIPSKEKRHRSLSQLLFRKTSTEKRTAIPGPMSNTKPGKVELLAGNTGIRYVNRRPEIKKEQQEESTKTRNAVYCAIILEEFVKELAALTQEHAVLHLHCDT